MGLFDGIGNFFGSFFGFDAGGGGSTFDVRGDHASVPGGMVTPDFRPSSPAGQGIWMDTSSQLIRAWEGRGWNADDGFIAELEQIDQEAKKSATNAAKAEKLLGSISKSEVKIVKHSTGAVVKVAQGVGKQYQLNQKMLTGLDNVAVSMAVAQASRDMEIQKARQQKQLRIQQRRMSIRGNSSMGLSLPGQRQPARFGQRNIA